MKWRRRLLLAVLFVAVFAGVTAIAAWRLAHGEPEWYRHHRLDPHEAEAAAGRAEQQLQRTLSWAQDRQAESIRQPRRANTTQPTAQSLEISFTQDELNALFQKWDGTFGWSDQYTKVLSEPEIALRDDRLILAGTSVDLGAVLSVEFEPRLADEKLYLSVTRVLAGRLPLPRSVWERYRGKLESRIERSLAQSQSAASLTPGDGANSDAVAAAMGELALCALAGEPAQPILFLPYSMRSKPRSLPVRLTDVRIADQTLTLTVQTLDAHQGGDVLHAIQSFKASQANAQ
jgi:hypothetical protein